MRSKWYWYKHFGQWFCRCNYWARSVKELRLHQVKAHKLNNNVFWERNAPDIGWFLQDQEDRIAGKIIR